MLAAGNILSEIYAAVLNGIIPELAENFMGYGRRHVSFIGHGIGLVVNEWQVIARGFDTSLLENMVIAFKPKCGVAGIETIGVEDTYVVGKNGGRCITSGGRDIFMM